MALRKEEIARKLLHLFALLIPIGIFYCPLISFLPHHFPIAVLSLLLVSSVVVEYLRFRIPFIQKFVLGTFGSMMREEETGKTTGSTYVIAAGLLCAILFHNHKYIAFMVLSLFILGDAIAAIVGLSMGRIKIGKKSLEGSAACFTLCVLLFLGVFPFVPGLLSTWSGKMPLIMVIAVALAITLFELIPLKITNKIIINDNLAVPVIAGYIMLGLEKALGL